jgi:hypothetical protein
MNQVRFDGDAATIEARVDAAPTAARLLCSSSLNSMWYHRPSCDGCHSVQPPKAKNVGTAEFLAVNLKMKKKKRKNISIQALFYRFYFLSTNGSSPG